MNDINFDLEKEPTNTDPIDSNLPANIEARLDDIRRKYIYDLTEIAIELIESGNADLITENPDWFGVIGLNDLADILERNMDKIPKDQKENIKKEIENLRFAKERERLRNEQSENLRKIFFRDIK
jgi:hypothetical protein